jgi:hypothetical protein
VPHFFDLAEVTKQVEESYNCPVAVVLPYNQELMALSSTSIFALQFPEDPLTKIFEKLAQSILETNE